VPFVLGRDFTDADRAGAPLVAIVSEQFAANAWPNENPIGKRISVSGVRGEMRTVVGVVREISIAALSDRSRSAIYLPQRQYGEFKDLTMMVRARGDASLQTTALRRLLRALDRDLPIYDVRTLAQYRDDSMGKERTSSILIGVFGMLAMLLASIGVYAVMAFRVSERTREIGVRIALGALRHQVVALVVRKGLRLTAVGLGIGVVLGLGVSRLLSAVLPTASATDPVPFVAVALLLGGVAALASWLPARRAARVDPMEALRHD
jgi:predicted permease